MKHLDQKSKNLYLANLKSLYDSGEDVSYQSVVENHISLLDTAIKEFGGWDNAVRAAGVEVEFDKSCLYNISKEEIIKELQNYYNHGFDVTWGNMSIVLNPLLASCAVRQFGTYEAALANAGIPEEEAEWTIDRIRNKLDGLFAEGHAVTRMYLIKNHRELLRSIYKLHLPLMDELRAAAKRNKQHSDE